MADRIGISRRRDGGTVTFCFGPLVFFGPASAAHVPVFFFFFFFSFFSFSLYDGFAGCSQLGLLSLSVVQAAQSAEGKEISSLDFHSIIGGPLTATIDAHIKA